MSPYGLPAGQLSHPDDHERVYLNGEINLTITLLSPYCMPGTELKPPE